MNTTFTFNSIDKLPLRRRADLNFPPTPNVLIIDDDIDTVRLLNETFTTFGCNTLMSFDGENALSLICSKPFDLVVIDWFMPCLSGGETLQEAQRIIQEQKNKYSIKSYHRVPTVIFSGKDCEEINIPDCQNFPLLDIWKKPMKFNELSRIIADTVQQLKYK